MESRAAMLVEQGRARTSKTERKIALNLILIGIIHSMDFLRKELIFQHKILGVFDVEKWGTGKRLEEVSDLGKP